MKPLGIGKKASCSPRLGDLRGSGHPWNGAVGSFPARSSLAGMDVSCPSGASFLETYCTQQSL